eukprot:354732-Chlamydomonas_euryale.AAC.1
MARLAATQCSVLQHVAHGIVHTDQMQACRATQPCARVHASGDVLLNKPMLLSSSAHTHAVIKQFTRVQHDLMLDTKHSAVEVEDSGLSLSFYFQGLPVSGKNGNKA